MRNWEDIPGAGTTGSINLVVRTAASGTQDAFQKIFMGSKTVFSGASAKASNGLVQQTVQTDKNAIGYVSQDFVTGHQRRLLPGRRLHAAPRQVRRVRRRAQLLDGHPRAPARGQRAAEVHPLGPDLARRAQKIVATHWVPLK